MYTENTFCDKYGKFSGKLFLEYLEREGNNCDYNGSKEFFSARPVLPYYFDEAKIKRAREFFNNNIMSMIAVSMAGLVALLSDSHGIRYLLVTNKSSEPLTACKRYMDTMHHMISWYNGDFSTGSELMRSLTTVRHMHNAAVKQGSKVGLKNINQSELTMTQFGFMGFAISRAKQFGLESATEEDMDALAHFWRVIGYMMGVEDRFNICRESLDETRSICNAAIDKLAQLLSIPGSDSLMLQFAVINGASLISPGVSPELFLNFIYELAHFGNEKHIQYPYKMNFRDKIQFSNFKRSLAFCKYRHYRRILNWNVRNFINITIRYPDIIDYHIKGKGLPTFI